MEKGSKIENAKQVQIKKIIHCSFALDEKFSIFGESNSNNHNEIDRIFTKIVAPYDNALELIKDVQVLSETTYYSFKRIYLPKGDSEILFCCSSISPKKLKNEEDGLLTSANSSTSATASAQSAIRNLKRENCESCPMRLKFKFDCITGTYLISEDSNFNHNHSSISYSTEDYKKKSQNIKFHANWILQIFTDLNALQKNIKIKDCEKSLSEVRTNLIDNNQIIFSDSTHKTNFCKKLIYLIKKINRIIIKTAKESTFEERFFVVFKYLLKRGANYLKQENLHLLNNMVKKSANNSFCFYSNFKKFIGL